MCKIICALRTKPAGRLCERAIDSSCTRSSALTTSSFAVLPVFIAERSKLQEYNLDHIRHVKLHTEHYTRTPHLNGKVERSHRVDEQEFYQLLDKDGIADNIHLFNDKLREWENYYNYNRPHGGLDGQTPYERLLAKKTAGNVSPAS